MAVKCNKIVEFLEETAPLHLAEEWDNCGLIIGNPDQDIEKVLVCLDATHDVIAEAVKKDVDMIISHHPVIYKGVKRINRGMPESEKIYELVKNNISIYCAHTNLDIAKGGTNDYLAGLLGLSYVCNLKSSKFEKLYKIVVFVPAENVESVRDAMSRSGAGWIGNYSDCSFMTEGTGTFKPLENANPYIGTAMMLEKVREYRLEMVVPGKNLHKVVSSMINAHPYEEVAYDIIKLDNNEREYGLGRVGVLKEPVLLNEFAMHVKNVLNAETIRVVGDAKKAVKTVAVLTGSFDNDFDAVKAKKVDVVVTGDVKYHAAIEALEEGISMIDAGHFETESIMARQIVHLIRHRFPQVEIMESKVEKSPYNYH